MRKFFKKYKFEIVLAFFLALYIVYFTQASFLRYDNFYTGRFDLGNMAQTVWNTYHGRIFQLTNPNGTENISRLAFHADFILILLAPFYFIWSSPKMLLLIQTIVLALGAVLIYLIAQKVLKNKSVSLAFAISYLLYPALEHTNLYDFHPVTLATTFLLSAFYFMQTKKYYLFVFFLILSGICKENIWAINAIFGLYLFWFQKKKIFGLSIFAISAFIFYFLIWRAIPQALGNQHFALSYYSDFGSTPTGVVKNIILSPIKTLHTLVGPDQLSYIRQLFIPVGYLSTFAPLFLIFAVPTLLINLLSNNTQLHQIYYQYSSTITPFVFISAVYAVSFLMKRARFLSFKIFTVLILIYALASSYSLGPLPYTKNAYWDLFKKPPEDIVLIDKYLERVPKRYSISATNNLGSHLSQRKNIYTIPVGLDKADYVMFLLNDSSSELPLLHEKNLALRLEENPKYKLVLKKGNFVVFRRVISKKR